MGFKKACSSLLKHDLSLGLQTETRTILIPKSCPLPIDCAHWGSWNKGIIGISTEKNHIND